MMMDKLRNLGVMAVLATAGFSFAIDAYPQTSWAQTQGMERRAERRATRQESREVKRECNAGQQNTRSECRQEKRDVKQGERPVAKTVKPAGSPPSH
jgi:hypothetical protein